MNLTSGIKDIERATHVFNVLFKNGMGYFLQKYGLKFHLPFAKRIAFHKYKKPILPEVRLRRAFEELGGTFVKLGQLLSLRPDLVPQNYCQEFSKLQDKVIPFSFEKVKKIVEKEMGKPLEKVFKKFEQKPLGSASISQVHLATLKNGKKVVVKVQRPGVREMFRADIDMMYYFAKRIENTKTFGRYSPLTIAKEFERYTKNELNFLVEAKNIDKFYENLKTSKHIKVPKLYRGYSTSRILTMQYIPGRKLSSLLRKGVKFDKKAVQNSLIHTCLKQVFEQNLFHADLHPGNILVLKGGQIALLDFGIAGGLTPYLRKEGIKLYVALVNRDIEKVTSQLLLIGKPSSSTDLGDFKREVDDIISGWHGTELRQVKVTHMLHQLFDSCIKHDIKMPVDMILLGKALVTAEGTGVMLNPRFNFVNESKSYVQKHIKKKLVTKEGFGIFLRKSQEIAEILEMIPSEALAVLSKLKHGVIKVDIDDTDLRRLALDIDKSSNRLSYSLVLAALIISGAMMMHANVGPYYQGFSVPAMVLYIIAGFMSLTLMVSILKEGAIWR